MQLPRDVKIEDLAAFAPNSAEFYARFETIAVKHGAEVAMAAQRAVDEEHARWKNLMTANPNESPTDAEFERRRVELQRVMDVNRRVLRPRFVPRLISTLGRRGRRTVRVRRRQRAGRALARRGPPRRKPDEPLPDVAAGAIR